jgi:hypothetical protein
MVVMQPTPWIMLTLYESVRYSDSCLEEGLKVESILADGTPQPQD